MALPPNIQKHKIRKRILHLTGKARVTEVKKILEELPNFTNGPYVEIRKNLLKEIETTKKRSKIQHQDWLGVPSQGHKQFVLVGRPSVGKSSLLSKLSGMDIKIANYEFTTLKPIPAMWTYCRFQPPRALIHKTYGKSAPKYLWKYRNRLSFFVPKPTTVL